MERAYALLISDLVYKAIDGLSQALDERCLRAVSVSGSPNAFMACFNQYSTETRGLDVRLKSGPCPS